jgi:hypothetical protein
MRRYDLQTVMEITARQSSSNINIWSQCSYHCGIRNLKLHLLHTVTGHYILISISLTSFYDATLRLLECVVLLWKHCYVKIYFLYLSPNPTTKNCSTCEINLNRVILVGRIVVHFLQELQQWYIYIFFKFIILLSFSCTYIMIRYALLFQYVTECKLFPTLVFSCTVSSF